jgi:hypothetical protein
MTPIRPPQTEYEGIARMASDNSRNMEAQMERVSNLNLREVLTLRRIPERYLPGEKDIYLQVQKTKDDTIRVDCHCPSNPALGFQRFRWFLTLSVEETPELYTYFDQLIQEVAK